MSQAIADPDTVAFTVWLDTLTALVAENNELLKGKVVVDPDKSAQAGRERNVAARSAPTQPVAFVAIRHEQRDEQLFWLTLLESIRHTVEGGRVEEPTQRYPAVLRRGDARSSAVGAGNR